jgi:hypothetical protein
MTLILSDSHELDENAAPVTFGHREKVVVPRPVRVCPQKRKFPGLSNDADLCSFSGGRIHRVKGIRFRFDLLDGCLASDFPVVWNVPDMSYVLMCAEAIRLRDAGDLIFAHGVRWLMPLIFGRIRIVPVAILVTDFSVAAVDHDLGFLLDSNFSRPLDSGLLGGMVGRVFLGVVASHGPTILSFYYVLVWHTLLM